jgi:hypothetical protein
MLNIVKKKKEHNLSAFKITDNIMHGLNKYTGLKFKHTNFPHTKEDMTTCKSVYQYR